jgi:hypothetical protein
MEEAAELAAYLPLSFVARRDGTASSCTRNATPTSASMPMPLVGDREQPCRWGRAAGGPADEDQTDLMAFPEFSMSDSTPDERNGRTISRGFPCR